MVAMLRGSTMSRSSVLAAELSESEAALRVYLTAGALILLGLLLVLVTIWWWRGTRPEPPALAPLEVMSDRKWAAANHLDRLQILEQNRPVGAEPLRQLPAMPERVDLSVLARGAPSGFDDLRESDPSVLDLTDAERDVEQADVEVVAEPAAVEDASVSVERTSSAS